MKTRSRIAVILSVLVIFALSLFSGFSTAEANTGKLADIQDKGSIRVGLSADYPPFEFKKGSKIVGIDVQIAEKLAEDLGVELEIVDMQFDSLLPSLEAGTIDVIVSGATYTEERDKSVDFSDTYTDDEQVLVIRKTDLDKYSTVDDFAGATIGAQQGTIQEELANTQITGADVYAVGLIPDLVIALNSSQIDAIVMEDAIAAANVYNNEDLTLIKNVGFQVDPMAMGKRIIYNEDEDALGEAINQTLAEIDQAGLFEDYQAQALADLEEATAEASFTEYWPYYWNGIKMTLLVSAIAIASGVILGFVLALMRLSNIGILQFLATTYIEFLRGTPLMIQILFVFIGLGAITDITPFIAGTLAISLNSGAYIAEIFRSGLQSVDRGQSEAARSLGLPYGKTLRRVIVPQALRTIWPSLGNEFITLIKESSLVSVIGVADLMYQTRAVMSVSFKGVLSLFVAMLIYFVITYGLTKLLNYLEGRMNKAYEY